MKKFTLLLFLAVFGLNLSAQTVSINGTKFYVEGQEIFFNGINTAWQPQSDWSLDFLGRNFDYNWWNNEFQSYVNNKVNLARVWIHGTGNYSPSLNGDGIVTGASSSFWSHMDQLVEISRSKKVYIMPTLWSFDMVKSDAGWAWYYNQYRQIVNDVNKTNWYIENFLIPFLQRYENEPYVMGYDICNEPEHMWRDSNCGNLNRDNVVRFIGMVASAINRYSSKPVTVGSMWIIFNSNRYNSNWESYMGNHWSNLSLQEQTGWDPSAYLDFYSPHWYAWQSTDGPFTKSIGDWHDDGSKPSLIGETYGGDVYSGHPSDNTGWNISMADYYLQSYWNGYAGVCSWKNPHEDDGQGTFAGCVSGTNAFYNNYPDLVYPNPIPDPVGTIYIQAENYSNMSGIQTETCSEGGENVGWIDADDWMSYADINIPSSGEYTIDYRVASPSGGSFRLEQAGGSVNYGTVNVPATGGWQTWTYVSQVVNLSAGTQNFGIKALTAGWNFNWWAITAGKKSSKVQEKELTQAEYVKIHPNPVQSYLRIDLAEAQESMVRIYSMSGKQVFSKKINESTEIDVKEASIGSGLFVIQIQSGKRTVRQKILID